MAIRFGNFELDEQRFQLRLGGRRLAIRPKVFDLLLLLVRSRERVVVRDELVLALWGTTAVGPGSLSGLVNELRQALGEDGRDISSIRTVHARGYQFVAVVESNETGESKDPAGSNRAIEEGISHWSGPGVELIRASFETTASFGARAALVTGTAGREWTILCEWATRALGAAGFEIIRSTRSLETDGSTLAVVDRLLDALVERYGMDSLQAMIPTRSRELLERCSKPERQQRLDALAAQQYEGRILRGAAELLTSLALARPVAFLFGAADLAAEDITSVLSPLLRLLEGSRVFMLGATDAPVSKDEFGRDIARSDSRIDWIECMTEIRSGPLGEGCNRLNAFLEASGIEALPRVLADAVVAHVRADENAIESLAIWLSSEARTLSQESAGSAMWLGSSRMRRVEPGGLARRSSVGPR